MPLSRDGADEFLTLQGPVAEGLSAAECKRRLSKVAAGDRAAAIAILDRPPLPPSVVPAGPVPAFSWEDDIAGDDPGDDPEPELLAGEHAVEGLAAVDDGIAGDAVGPVEAGDAAVGHIPHEIEGMPVRVVAGRHHGGYNYHDRISVRCRNPAHANCSRSRSTALQIGTYGPRAAEFYLEAWLLSSDTVSAEQRKSHPRAADIHAYADSR